jgi:hypothetical protein
MSPEVQAAVKKLPRLTNDQVQKVAALLSSVTKKIDRDRGRPLMSTPANPADITAAGSSCNQRELRGTRHE